MAKRRRRSKAAEDFVESQDRLEVHRLRQQVKDARARERKALDRLVQADERLRLALAIAEPSQPKPVKPRLRGKGREATAVIMASDWHIEEEVKPETVNGRNRYDLSIAERRSREFFRGAEWLIQHHRPGITITDAILWLGGDLITGYIHPELIEVAQLSPAQAIVRCQQLLMAGINALVERCGLSRLVILCNYGNHGRTTVKRRIATGAANSFEWLMYQSLAQAYAAHDLVEVHVADGALLHLEVYDWRLRFTHGDSVRGGGGVGGLSIPLLKRIGRWDHNIAADYTVLGHFHQLRDYGRAVVNGSLIGWSPYAVEIGAEYEPPQQGFFLVDKRRGKCQVTPIWVADHS